MGYLIAFRKSQHHRVEYHYEREFHLAADIADAIYLEGYDLLNIQSASDSYPLTIGDVLARRDAKAIYCKALEGNPYVYEEKFAVDLFRRSHPIN